MSPLQCQDRVDGIPDERSDIMNEVINGPSRRGNLRGMTAATQLSVLMNGHVLEPGFLIGFKIYRLLPYIVNITKIDIEFLQHLNSAFQIMLNR
jgi:hypothetical protein